MSNRTLSRIFRRLLDLRRDRRGNVTVMMGFLLPPLIGTFGLGFEVANWYLTTRSMQNAADSAAVAIATTAGTNYLTEARAVAAQYGFTNGVNNVTVAASNTAACPGGGNTCYSVTITQTLSLFLSQVIGYPGNATLNQTNANQQTTTIPAQQLTSTAVANQSSIQVPLCLLALGKSGAQDIVTNGNPKANMTGCNVMANTSATCNGSNLNAPYGLAHGTDNGCGVIQVSGVKQVTDPYAGLATNIPPNLPTACSNANGSNNPYPGSTWSNGTWPPNGAVAVPGYANNYVMCGNVQLGADVNISPPAGSVLIIENGNLDTNGNNLTATGLPIVFSGPQASSAGYPTDTSHGSSNNGLNITAPTDPTSPWAGVAIYQDPNLTTSVNITAAGNKPTWNISGLVYLPYANVTLSGAVNKNGQTCFVMVMDEITINGTGDVAANDTTSGCANVGLKNMPQATIPGRGQLVN